MDRLKTFLIYILLIIAFYFFVDAMIYLGIKKANENNNNTYQQTVENSLNNIINENNENNTY